MTPLRPEYDMKGFTTTTLTFLLIAQYCYSLPVPEATVSVPVSAIYYHNAVLDSLNHCKEDNATLLKGIRLYELAVEQRDTALKLQQQMIKGLEQMDANSQKIALEYKKEVQKQKGNGWIKGVFGAMIGAFIMSIANR